MTITITPGIEKGLTEEAQRQGTTPETLALDALQAIGLTPGQEAWLNEKAAMQGKAVDEFARDVILREAEPDEWLRLLYSIGSPGAVISDEAACRESLYEDHL